MAGLYLKNSQGLPLPPTPLGTTSLWRAHTGQVQLRLTRTSQEAVGTGRQEVSCPRSHCRLATDPKSVRLGGWVLSHCITSPL